MSDSVRPHRRQPTRPRCPWDSPGKNTGVGCHFLLQCMKVKSKSEVAQLCPTLSDLWTAAYQAPPSMGFSRQEYSRLYRILYVCHAGTWADLASLTWCQAHTNTHTAAPCVQPLAPGRSTRVSSQSRDQTRVSCIAGRLFTI